MAIFNSYVNLPEGNFPDIPNISTCFDDEPPVFTVAMEAMALLQMIYPPKKMGGFHSYCGLRNPGVGKLVDGLNPLIIPSFTAG